MYVMSGLFSVLRRGGVLPERGAFGHSFGRALLTGWLGALVLALAPADAAQASPRDSVALTVSLAEVLPLERTPATVVIGNPDIADVIVGDERTLILTGRAAGITNLIVIDAAGERFVDLELRVTSDLPQHVVVQAGASRSTFVCAPRCEELGSLTLPGAGDQPPVPAAGVEEAPPIETEEAPVVQRLTGLDRQQR
jgi:hypothetical protein